MNPIMGKCIAKIIGNIHFPKPSLEMTIPPMIPPMVNEITPGAINDPDILRG
jgi:hypothetical protein